MRLFELKKHHTTVRQEVIAGFTTFLAMLYIVPVNAAIMSLSGMPYDALITATAVITLIASVLNGLWANTPIAMSVGMGLNAYFTFGLVQGMKIPWQSALGIVFVSGILYFIVSITPLRRWMIDTIPLDIKKAVSAAIGAFIAFIGLKEAGIIVDSKATLVTLGDMKSPSVMLALLGIVLGVWFYSKRIKAAFILSILITAAVAWLFGLSKIPQSFISLPASMLPIAFKMDISSALTLSLFPVVITFFVTDLFDTLGTLVGVGLRADIFKEKRSKELQKTIEADAAATVMSSFAGVSSTTSFIESAAGVEEGGRTGLSAVVTGLLFLLPLFFLPLFKSIHPNAIYPILVIVGALMFSELKNINYKDPAIKFSTFFMVLMMPLTYSITNGLMFGAFMYIIIRLIEGEFREIKTAMGMLALIGILIFYIL